MLPIFVIGMESHRQRYRKTLALLEAQGLKASLWPGLDMHGRKRLEDGESVCRFCHILFMKGSQCHLGEVGCYFAHVRLMKHLLAQNVERALVLECDAQLPKDFPSLLEDIEKLDVSCELIFLYHKHLSAYRKAPSHQPCRGRNLHFVYGPLDGCVGYVISRTAIEKLLPRLLTMRWPIDQTLSRAYLTGVATYAVLPRIVETSTKSSIREQRHLLLPYHPEASVSAYWDQALSFLLIRARWLRQRISYAIRAYWRCRMYLYILRNIGSHPPRPCQRG